MRVQRIVLIVLIVGLLLTFCSACTQAESKVETTFPAETLAPTSLSETEAPISEPLSTEPFETESIIPESATPLTQEELDALTELFTQELPGEDHVLPYTNWYNMAMTTHYETAEQLDIARFISQGIGGPDHKCHEPSDAEKAFLETQPQIHLQYSLYRMPQDTVNEVLQQYFGMTLEEMDGVGLDQMAYSPETDCYYWTKSAVHYVVDFEITEGYHLPDGNIQFTYWANYRETIMIIKPVEGGYHILSDIWLVDWLD